MWGVSGCCVESNPGTSNRQTKQQHKIQARACIPTRRSIGLPFTCVMRACGSVNALGGKSRRERSPPAPPPAAAALPPLPPPLLPRAAWEACWFWEGVKF